MVDIKLVIRVQGRAKSHGGENLVTKPAASPEGGEGGSLTTTYDKINKEIRRRGLHSPATPPLSEKAKETGGGGGSSKSQGLA